MSLTAYAEHAPVYSRWGPRAESSGYTPLIPNLEALSNGQSLGNESLGFLPPMEFQ